MGSSDRLVRFKRRDYLDSLHQPQAIGLLPFGGIPTMQNPVPIEYERTFAAEV